MFTSRAEFRLHLRIDNADQRLTPIGRKAGSVDDEHWTRFETSDQERKRAAEFLAGYRPDPADPTAQALFAWMGGIPANRTALEGYLRRPEVSIDDVLPLIAKHAELELSRPEWKAVETQIKFAGYLEQQKRQVIRLKKAESHRIPDTFRYAGIPGLSREMIEKMERVRPRTLAQAARIPGVTPAAVSILNLHLEAPRPEPVDV
jgi:tRNA uridine 5-carboxymethylaminomethyl modification enzyme